MKLISAFTRAVFARYTSQGSLQGQAKSFRLPLVLALLAVIMALSPVWLAAAGVAYPFLPNSSIWCVDDNGGATDTPCTNPTAFVNIQDAINSASSGDEVRVAVGTYLATTGTAVVNIDRAIALTGGYIAGPGGWTTPGDENGTVIDGQGIHDGVSLSAGGITAVVQNVTVSNGAVRIAANSTLNNNMPVRTSALNQSTGIIGGSAPISVTGVLTWTGGTMSGPGETDILTGTQTTIASPVVTEDSGRSINNFGTIVWPTNDGSLRLNSGATLNNRPGATFTASGNNQNIVSTTGSGVFNNFSTFNKTGSGSSTFQTAFNNTGTMGVQSGIASFGGLDSTGTVNVAAGAVLSTCNCSAVTFEPGSSITGSGTFNNDGDNQVIISGTLGVPVVNLNGGNTQIDSSGSNATTTVMTLTVAATLKGSRTISVTNSLNWTGTMQGSGHTDVLAGTVAHVNANARLDDVRVLNNFGAMTYSNNPTNGGITLSGGSVFNNFGSLTWDNQTTFNQGITGNIFNNFGTVTKTGPGPVAFTSTFNNQGGTVNIAPGAVALEIDNVNAASGAANIAGGTTLLMGVNNIFQQDSVISGTGTLESDGGFPVSIISGTISVPIVTINGPLQLDSAGPNTTASFNVLNLNGNLQSNRGITITNQFNWSGDMRGPGATNVLTGTIFTMGSSPQLHDGRTLNNFTSVTMPPPGLAMGSDASFNNYGTLTASGGGHNLNGGTFNNQGTFVRTGSGDSTFQSTFNNTGSVNLQSGRSIFGGGDSPGVFNVSSGAVFDLLGGQILEPTSTVSGTGTLESDGGFPVPVISGTISVPTLNVVGRIQIDSAGANTGTSVSDLNVSGVLGGSRTITVTHQLDWSNTMEGTGHTVVLPGTVFNIDVTSGGVALTAPRVLDNYSTVNWNNPSNQASGFSNGGTFINEPGASFPMPSSFGQNYYTNITNFGTITKLSDGSSPSNVSGSTTLAGGIVDVQGGTLTLSANGNSTTMLGGTLRMSGGDLAFEGPFTMQGGTLEGSGTIDGDVDNEGGTVSPGLNGPGLITISSFYNYTQGSNGKLNIELGGTDPSQYDRLEVGSTAALNGTLNTSAINGFVPQNGDSFTVLMYGFRSGTFSSIQGGDYTANYNPNDLTLLVGQGGVATATPTGTSVPTSTPTFSPTSTSAPTNIPTQTPTASMTPSNTPTGTNTPANTSTSTRTPSNTPTNSPTLTNTPTVTATSTGTATNAPTGTSTSTRTPSNTPSNTSNPTNTPSSTGIPTGTPTRTNTSTNTPTVASTSTRTNTPSNTPTNSPSSTNSPTATRTPTSTSTLTATSTRTPTASATATPLPGCWSIYPSPNSPGQIETGLYDVAAVSANDVWAVGWDNTATPFIEHWDGSRWSIVPVSPLANTDSSTLGRVTAIASNDVWAVGEYYITGSIKELTLAMHYDGTAWTQVDSPSLGTSSYLSGVSALAHNNVWAVGAYNDPSTQLPTPYLLHYNGTFWAELPGPSIPNFSGLSSVKAISATDVWAVGHTNSGGVDHPLILHYDGTSWNVSPIPPGVGTGDLYSVDATSSNNVWTVGYDGYTFPFPALALHWDGTQWSTVPMPAAPSNHNYILADLTVLSAGEAWAVGYDYSFNGGASTYSTIVMHWGGGSWALVPSANVSGFDNLLFGVDRVSTNDIWAVGDSQQPNVSHTLVERFTNPCSPPTTPTVTATRTPTPVPPTSTRTSTSTPTACPAAWSVVGSQNQDLSYNQLVGVEAVGASDVWAVGYSSESGGTEQTLIEHWDGSSWSIVPSPNQGTEDNELRGMAAVGNNDVWAVGYYISSGAKRTLIEHWNGTAWSIVSSPNQGGSDNVLFSVSMVTGSNMWAVGYYNSGEVARTLGEHWNGTAWTISTTPNQGIGLENELRGVAAVGPNDVWAVGYYRTSGGTERTLIEHWNGTGWLVISSPNQGSGYNELDGVAAIGTNDVWAVGYYLDTSITKDRTLIEHWNGSSWSVVSSPSQGSYDSLLLSVSAAAGNDAWAVGYYYGGGIEQTLIEHWNGTAWSIVSSPNHDADNNYPHAVAAIGPNDVWMAGYYEGNSGLSQTLLEHWDGTAWSLSSSPNQGISYSYLIDVAAVGTNDVWAVGFYNNTYGIDQTLAEHWDGTAWFISTTPNQAGNRENHLRSVTAVRSSDVWAVGYYDNNSGTAQTLIEHWNGTAWSIVSSPNQGSNENQLNGVVATGSNDAWAVGYYRTSGGTAQTLIEHWNGSSWSIVSSPNQGSGYNYLEDVAATGTNDIWAVGYYLDSTTTARTLIEHWNGSSWSIGSPNQGAGGNYLYGVAAVGPNDVWAAGNYDSSGSQRTLIEHWNGTAWSVISSPNQGSSDNPLLGVSAVSSNDVWAVGYYRIGSLYQTLIEHWNGTAWSVVSSPNQGSSSNYLEGVAAIGTNDVWAAGYSYTGSGHPQTLTLHSHSVCATPSVTPTRTTVVSPTSTPTSTPTNYVVVTATGTIVAGTLDIGNHCGNCTTTVRLPFAVGLYEGRFSSLAAGSNGTIGFLENRNPDSNTCLPTTSLDFAVLPYWEDLDTSCQNCGIFTSVSGAAPRRVFNIEWRATSRMSGGSVNFEARFHEGSSDFDLIYGRVDDPGSNETIGVQRDTGSLYTWIACPQGGLPKTGQDLPIGEGTLLSFDIPPSGPTPTPTACSIQFSDVLEGSTFYPYIRCLACRGIVSGYADGTFRPGNSITRGQLSKLVSNADGLTDDPGDQIFEDVLPGSTFYDYVQRLAVRSYVSGYPCGGDGEPCGPANLPYFRPGSNATRGQISKIVSNAASFADTITGQTFADVPAGSAFYDFIGRLAMRGIVSGYPCGGPREPCDPQSRPYFRWNSVATRGQVSKIVANTYLPDCQTPGQH